MAFPKIRILHGYHYYWRKIIMLAAETQVAFISRESSQKTDLLKSQIERQTLMQSAHSRDSFLADLQVKTNLKRLTAQDEQALQRCHELLNKTNQFNTTTVRRSLAEFTQFVNAHAVYFFQVSDRFTDHGIVGLVLLQGSSIEQFVMSCRVVGLDVEYGVLNLLMDILNARQPGQAVTARMTVADKNLLSRAIFSDCGFEQILDSDVWRLVEFKAPTFQGQFEWVQ
jgi:FkbH-like protein